MVRIAARRVAYIKKQSAGSACKSTDRISCCRFAMAANQRHGNHTISQPPAPAAHLNAWICPEARGPLVSPFACSYSAKKQIWPASRAKFGRRAKASYLLLHPTISLFFCFFSLFFSREKKKKRRTIQPYLLYFPTMAFISSQWASMSATSLNWVRQRSRF